MDNCYINLGAVKAKEIDRELYISCWDFSKALAEKEKEISDLCKENDELEKKISELEAQIERDKELLEVKTAEVSISEDKILSCLCPYCGKIVAGKIPNGCKVNEESLPFSSDEYEEETKTELPTMPIDVASMLINATIEYPTISLLKAFGAGEISVADKYSKSDLREIAEHLLIYCNASDENSNTQS